MSVFQPGSIWMTGVMLSKSSNRSNSVMISSFNLYDRDYRNFIHLNTSSFCECDFISILAFQSISRGYGVKWTDTARTSCYVRIHRRIFLHDSIHFSGIAFSAVNGHCTDT